MFIPALIIIVGLIWLFTNLGIISTSALDFILPLAVILFGISMYAKHGKCCKPGLPKGQAPHEGHGHEGHDHEGHGHKCCQDK